MKSNPRFLKTWIFLTLIFFSATGPIARADGEATAPVEPTEPSHFQLTDAQAQALAELWAQALNGVVYGWSHLGESSTALPPTDNNDYDFLPDYHPGMILDESYVPPAPTPPATAPQAPEFLGGGFFGTVDEGSGEEEPSSHEQSGPVPSEGKQKPEFNGLLGNWFKASNYSGTSNYSSQNGVANVLGIGSSASSSSSGSQQAPCPPSQ